MPLAVPKKALYEATYDSLASPTLAQVQREAYGEDIGQNSYLTVDEYRELFRWLQLGSSSTVLDIGSGSGGPTLFLARTTGCRAVGVDNSAEGVAAAERMARTQRLGSRVQFRQADAARRLPFDDGAFDALVCVDTICHLRDRARVLREWRRLLRPGGHMLFTDPVVVTGLLSNDEITRRSSLGRYYAFAPMGENERLIRAAGFALIRRMDLTANLLTVSRRRYEARKRHRKELIQVEGQSAFREFQCLLSVVHKLAAERRCCRFGYVGRKPGN